MQSSSSVYSCLLIKYPERNQQTLVIEPIINQCSATARYHLSVSPIKSLGKALRMARDPTQGRTSDVSSAVEPPRSTVSHLQPSPILNEQTNQRVSSLAQLSPFAEDIGTEGPYLHSNEFIAASNHDRKQDGEIHENGVPLLPRAPSTPRLRAAPFARPLQLSNRHAVFAANERLQACLEDAASEVNEGIPDIIITPPDEEIQELSQWYTRHHERSRSPSMSRILMTGYIAKEFPHQEDARKEVMEKMPMEGSSQYLEVPTNSEVWFARREVQRATEDRGRPRGSQTRRRRNLRSRMSRII